MNKILTIIKRIEKKTVFFGITMFFAGMFLLFLVLKSWFLLSDHNENIIKEISDFFKNTLGRAVRFEDVEVGFFGSITLKNFHLSISSDFNDNIDLIKSERAVVSLDFLSFLRRDAVVEKIVFSNAELNFIMKYRENYADIVKNLTELWRGKDTVKKINFNDCAVVLDNAHIQYRESIREDAMTLEIYSVSAECRIDKESFHYRLKGNIKPYKNNDIRKGLVDINGRYYPEKNIFRNNYFLIEDFDLTYLNEIIREHQLSVKTVSGAFSLEVEINTEDQKTGVRGRIDTNNLYLHSGGPEKHDLIANENISLSADIAFDDKIKRYELRGFELHDDNASIEAEGNLDRLNETLLIYFTTNRINLNGLSNYVKPLAGYRFDGFLQAGGKVDIDLKNSRDRDSVLFIDLKKTSVDRHVGNKWEDVISDLFIQWTYDKNKISLNARGTASSSDFLLSGCTEISSWVPFRSDTAASFVSKKMSLGIIFSIVSECVDSIYAQASVDKKRGWEDIFFLQKPIGRFVAENNFFFSANIKTLTLGGTPPGKAALDDFSLGFLLHNGVLVSRDFSLNGYDASYSFNLQGFYNNDHPLLKIDGGVSNFNLEKYSKDSGQKVSMSGTMTADFTYELPAFRLSQILENSKGSFSLNFANGVFEKLPVQNRVSAYLNSAGYPDVDITKIRFSNISLSASQTGENFQINNAILNGDTLNLAAYGYYTHEKGLVVNSTLSCKDSRGMPLAIPLKIYRSLLSPCVSVQQSTVRELCF